MYGIAEYVYIAAGVFVLLRWTYVRQKESKMRVEESVKVGEEESSKAGIAYNPS